MATTTMCPTATIFSTIPTATAEPMQGVPPTAVQPDDLDYDGAVPSFAVATTEQLPGDETTVLPVVGADA
jgi:hypothetical protein